MAGYSQRKTFFGRRLCSIIVTVEHLLNLLWLSVVGVLFASVVRCGRKGLLRCSMPVALGATVLLALVLFPALSMTDDLQRAKMDTESTCRHLSAVFLLGSTQHASGTALAMLPFLLLLLLFGSRLLSAEFLARLGDPACTALRGYLRVVTARPPPALLPA